MQRYTRQYRTTPADAAAAGPAAQSQSEMFANRLANRARHLRKWPQRGITCFRLYERDMPEIPLVIDRYEECLHIVERPRPHDRSLAEHHRWLDGLAAAAVQTLGVAADNVFLKRYADRLPLLAAASAAPATHVVQELGLRYQVNLRDYSDTGLPLNLRTLRTMIRKLAAGKRFLSLFGNTGASVVAAAAGGAASTVTVDPLEVHTQWAQQNLALNGFSGPEHRVVCASPEDDLQKAGSAFDLITIEDHAYSQQSQARLLPTAMDCLTPHGALLWISHERRVRPPVIGLEACRVHEITTQTLPDDFRSRVHRVWRIVHASQRSTSAGNPADSA
jgi:23S rRNA (guanine2445-N2)-methyltransferase / 23S rRNA (guanine2069-N7)-methyltransferase